MSTEAGNTYVTEADARDHLRWRAVSAVAVETPDGDLLALLILPMHWDAFSGAINALHRHFPGVMVREAARYSLKRIPPETVTRAGEILDARVSFSGEGEA